MKKFLITILIAACFIETGLLPSAIADNVVPTSSEKVLMISNDFEKSAASGINTWRFTQEQKDANYAVIRKSSDAFSGKSALELTLSNEFPFVGDNAVGVCPIIEGMGGGREDYFLPPETDAVRMQIKVLEGEFRFFVTAETIFLSSLGNVNCGGQIVKPSKNDSWQSVDFPLYKTLSRDFYAYSYCPNPKAPVYFSRWNQFCPKLAFSIGSHGKVLIDKIELINCGISKPYPVFNKEDVKIIAKIADFEDEKDMESLCTVYMTEKRTALSGPVPADFKSRKKDPAASLTRINDIISKSNVLEYTKQFHEEKSYVGFKLPQVKDANAFSMKLYMEHISKDKRTIIPIDFFFFSAPDKASAAEFPFKEFSSPEEWKKDADFGYDYYLPRNLLSGKSIAFYQVRRGIQHSEWNDVVIPFSDLVCVYGSGSMQDDYIKQKPVNPENIFAVLFVTPHYPLGYAQTKHMIDDVQLIKINAPDSQLRSYWQMPAEMTDKIKFVRDPLMKNRGGVLHQQTE